MSVAAVRPGSESGPLTGHSGDDALTRSKPDPAPSSRVTTLPRPPAARTPDPQARSSRFVPAGAPSAFWKPPARRADTAAWPRQELVISRHPVRPKVGFACGPSHGELDGRRLSASSQVDERTLGGYARVSTEQQDLTSQRNGLHALGVGDDRIYVDHGLTGTNRDRPGLRWRWPPAEPATPWW